MAKIDVVSQYEPTPTQKITHAASQRYKLFGGAVGGGKTKFLCEEVKELSIRYPGNRIVMCRYHLSDFKNSTLKTLLEAFPPELIESHNKADNTITVVGGSEIIYMGMSEEQNVSKIKSMEMGAFAMDEASEIPYSAFLLFQSRLRRRLPNGEYPPFFGLLASNPDDCWLKDYFLESTDEDKKTSKVYKLDDGREVSVIYGDDRIFVPSLPRDNPYLPDTYEDDLRKTYPEDWVQRFLEGSWDDLSSGDKVLPYSWVRAAVNREIAISDKPVIGVDVARYGEDEIVICCGNGNAIVEPLDITHRKSTMETASRIHMFYNKHKAKKVVVDDIGVGGGVTDKLRELGLKVQPINVGSRAEHDQYFNLKTHIWFYARELFENGQVSIVNDPILIRQLSGVKYKIRTNSKLQIEDKGDTKKRIGTSPDRADAFLLMLWGARNMRDPARDFARKSRAFSFLKKEKPNKYGWTYNE